MSRCGGFDALLLIVSLVFAAIVPRPVGAADRFFIDPAGGLFNSSGRWSATDGGPGGASFPGASDIANFTLNNTYEVTFAAAVTNAALDIENGNVTFNLGFTYTATSTFDAIEVGRVSGQTGRLTIITGIFGVDTAGDQVQIGASDGSTGFLTVSTKGQLGTDAVRPDAIVGDLGTGTLTVQNDGEVFTGLFTVGDEIGSTGTVTVTGPQASLDASNALTIGDAGAGTMTVSNGADFVGGGTATLGFSSGSTGTLTITGAGSTWTQATTMTVGLSGVGTLNVQSSGSLSTGNVSIGDAGSVLAQRPFPAADRPARKRSRLAAALVLR